MSKTLRPLYAVIFLSYLAQMTLNPIIAPLSREVGLQEWEIGFTLSASAIMVVFMSQIWGNRSQVVGRKPVILVGITGSAITMALFALVAGLGMKGVVTGTLLFALFLATRGFTFGIFTSAMSPAAQAYIADVTETEAERIKGMAGVGAVQGVAMVLGSVVGGLLSVFGLMTPIIAVPVVLFCAVAMVAVALPRAQRRVELAKPPKLKATDTRVWPYLLAGFGMYLALGFIQIITGFVIQDRLHLTATQAGGQTGIALLAAGVGMLISQGLIVPKSGWGPVKLLRIGTAIATVGFVMLVPDMGKILILASVFVIGVGVGIAAPGFMSGSTLSVEPQEQGAIGGLNSSTLALTFVIAPTLATALYGYWPVLPIVFGGICMALVMFFVWLHPRFASAIKA